MGRWEFTNPISSELTPPAGTGVGGIRRDGEGGGGGGGGASSCESSCGGAVGGTRLVRRLWPQPTRANGRRRIAASPKARRRTVQRWAEGIRAVVLSARPGFRPGVLSEG